MYYMHLFVRYTAWPKNFKGISEGTDYWYAKITTKDI